MSFLFYNNSNKKGTLASVSMPGHSTTFVYDELLRLQSETDYIQGQSYTAQYTYDGFGRPLTTTYPSDYATKQVYNSFGYNKGVADNQTSQLLYEVNLVNALGQLNKSTTGNGYITNKTYFPLTYRLKSVKTEIPGNQIIQDMEYGWTANGNLTFRKKWISRPQNNSITESFTYDNLNRLVSIYLNGSHLGMHQYDADGLGNLSYKKTDGQVLFQNATYGGNNAGPHALTSAATSAGIFPPEQQNISYNAFDKVSSISEGNQMLQITYGHHRQRIRQQYTASGSTTYKVYVGACEYITKNGQTTIHTYLSGPEGLFAVVVKEPNGTSYIRYIHTDHLGSWNTISDAAGNRLQEINFDAWGNRRDPNTWRAFATTPAEPLFDRGFTGHEHLYGFQLINMNGRMYDPVVSRMLSPDNFVQAPDFSQSFNRYSYAWNNPLVYTDPDGEIIVPILIGAGISVITNGIQNSINDHPFFQGAFEAAIQGGIGGAFSFGIGQVAMGMSGFGKVAFQTLAHGHLGGVMSGGSGGSYGQGFLSGAAGSLIGGGAGSLLKNAGTGLQAVGTVAAGALAGGIGAEIMGGNFWDGARNGAISAGLNHAYHSTLSPKILIEDFRSSDNFEEYASTLESNLKENGFSHRTDVIKSTEWTRVWNWAKGNPTATVSFRYSVGANSPANSSALGWAVNGSNQAYVYGRGTYYGIKYSPSVTDLVNVTTHELGHAIFSFSHSVSGIMNSHYKLGSPLIPFYKSQQLLIYNSIWGGR